MTAPLAFIFAVAAAYLAAHVLFDWLARRFLIVSGAEYLVLGILLGPQVSGLLSASVIGSLAPILTLALGWIGVIMGTQFDLKRLVNTPSRDFRIGFAESALTFLLVASLEFVVLRWLIADTDENTLLAAVSFGAIAVASSGVGVTLVTQLANASGRIVDQLRLSSAINSFVAIAIFGVLLCVHHVPAPLARPLTATEWVVVCCAVGLVCGMLFHAFVGNRPDRDRWFVALVGAIVMVSGAATYLRVSPLLSAFFFGAILVNTMPEPAMLIATLTHVERPFYFVLLVFGGAAWEPSSLPWVAPVAMFLAARAAGKIGGSRLAARMNGALGELGDNFGRALLGQGRLAIAIGLSYLRQNDLPFRNLVFTAAVASVLITEFMSARAARWVITNSTSALDAEFAADVASAANESSDVIGHATSGET